MVICWDPTWELLGFEPSSVVMTKSQLRKLKDAEVYNECLLEECCHEASSDESSTLFQYSVSPSDTGKLTTTTQDGALGIVRSNGCGHHLETERSPLDESTAESESATLGSENDFVLGYHFDPKRFSITHCDELEITFIDDDDECIGQSTDGIDAQSQVNPCTAKTFFSPCSSPKNSDTSDTITDTDSSSSLSTVEGLIDCSKANAELVGAFMIPASPTECFGQREIYGPDDGEFEFELLPSPGSNNSMEILFEMSMAHDESEEGSSIAVFSTGTDASDVVDDLVAFCTTVS